jgi:PTS system mannose-specific IIB component/fructoselysine and glucoselysine-specific PTS system IIB component
MTVYFHNVPDAAHALASYQTDPRPGIVLAGNIATMARLVEASGGSIRNVNIGGVHHAPGRVPRLRYVFLNAAEAQGLREIAERGVTVSAQDLPGTKPVVLDELLTATLDA